MRTLTAAAVRIFVTILLGFAVWSCRPASPITRAAPTISPTVTPPPSVKKTSIALWEEEGDLVDAFLDEVIANFMSNNPDIEVVRAHYENEELREEFQTAALVGAGPELVRGPNQYVGPFSGLGLLAPVDDVFDGAFLDQFYPGAVEPAIVGGVTWGVPDDYGNHLMLLYNKELLAEPPLDTGAMIEVAKGLTGDGQYGLAFNVEEPFWLVPWIGGFGGWPLDALTDMPTLGTKSVKDALQFVHDLSFVHHIVPSECDYDAADTLFKEGKAAMLINGDWSLEGYAEAGIEFGTAPIPKVSATGLYPSPLTSGDYYMINRAVLDDVAKTEAVRAFVTYMTSAAVQAQWLARFGRLPSSKQVAGDPLILSNERLAGSMAQLAHGKGMPAAPQARCVWEAMGPNLEAVMADEMPPGDAAEEMQREAMSCVEEAGLAPTVGESYVIATYAAFPPMEFVGQDEAISGFDIDLMNAIAEAARIEVEFRQVAWEGIFAGLQAEDYDAILSAVTITARRKQAYDFSDPYLNAGQVVVVRADETEIGGHEDLLGKTVGAQIETTGASAVEDIEGATLEQYDSIELALADLLNGVVEAVVVDLPPAAYYTLASAQFAGQVKIVGQAFTDQNYGLVVRKGDTDLVRKFNEGLARVRASGLYDELYGKWITGETPGDEVPGKEPVTLTFWHTQEPEAFRGQLMGEIIQDFQKEYPWITIESSYQGSYTDLHRKMMATIAAGEVPDFAVAYPSEVSEYMKADAVVPLDAYISDPEIGLTAEDLADIFPGYLEECRFAEFDDQYLAFPFTKSYLGMWYNMDLLKAAGWDKVPETWAEFEQACNDVSQKTDGRGYAYYESASTFDAWLFSRGAEQLNEAQTEAIFNGPEAVESLEMMLRLIESGGAWKPEGSYADQAEFGQGKAAFTMSSTSGTYYYGQAISDSGDLVKEWGQTILPQSDPSNPKTVMYGGSICVFKTTEAKQRAAWLFIKFFTDTAQTAKWGSQSGYMPVRASAAALLEDYFADNPVAKEQFEKIVPYGKPEPAVRGEQEIRDFIYDAMVAAFSEVMTAQEALDEAVELANEALARGRE